MESAAVPIAGGVTVEIRRGMAVRDRSGGDAGLVAAICVDEARSGPTALVLWMGQSASCYRLIAAGHIASVAGEVVHLALSRAAIRQLPPRRAL